MFPVPAGNKMNNPSINESAISCCIYVRSCGLPTPSNYNPADHFVRQLAVEPGKETECREKIQVIYRDN